MSTRQQEKQSSRVSSQSTPSFSNMRDSVQFWRGVVGYRQADYRGDIPEPISGLSNDPMTQSLRNRNSSLQQRNDSHHHGMSMISTTSTQPPLPSSRSPRQRHTHTTASGGNRRGRHNHHNSRSSSSSSSSPSLSCTNALDRHRLLHRMLNSTGWKSTLIVCSVLLLFGAQLRDLALPASADLVVDCVFLVVCTFLLVDIVVRCDAEPHYCPFGCFRQAATTTTAATPVAGPKTSANHWTMGSFLFWCDVLSTVTLLYDVRLLTEGWGVQEVVIVLSNQGIPTSGMERYNRYIPVEYDPNMLVLIVQTLRVARFIRSSRAVKISSILGSCLRRILLCEQPARRRGGAGGITEPPTSVQPSSSFWSSGFKRSSVSSSARWMMWGRPDHTEEFRRTLAATKIQRAWRAARQADGAPDLLGSNDFDVGWRPTGASRRRPDGQAGGTTGAISSAMRGGRASTRRRNESQVGSAMRELTGQRVAVGIILALLLTVLFTYVENDATVPFTMVVLHTQTSNLAFAEKALSAAKNSSVPNMFRYESSDGLVEQDFFVEVAPELLRVREQLRIVVSDASRDTTGYFSRRDERFDEAFVGLMSTIFILFVWFFGVTGFAGPVMVLVVVPIERMVRLLGMLMVDPLGYQSTSRYKRFVDEEDEITKNTRWSKEILKGMETSFLMSTILRIGSLMKVGFGSAGVEIIRNNLEPGQSQNTLILSSQGSTVSCIFLFCDIRNFTDATECLQEEVFVFTNRIAAVVHSFCHAYGGSANKNVGDAFLLSWQLEEESISMDNQDSFSWSQHHGSATKLDGFVAKNNQADKALLSVVKICMSLNCDDYFIEPLTEVARSALVNKLKQREGPVVQMGFGLHAGRAVQGAIGSQRKIDATYVSEAVERAEFLESSTKKYGLRLLMSDSFQRLLNPSNKRRCRKVDQIRIRDDEDGEDEIDLNCETMDLFTFDMDIEALSFKYDNPGREASDTASDAGSKRGSLATKRGGRRLSMRVKSSRGVDDSSVDDFDPSSYLTVAPTKEEAGTSFQLTLPTGPALYNPNVWTSEDMKTIRELYSDGLFFQKFMSGLQSFYAKDWDNAKQCFSVILERFEDGPSRYFVRQIEMYNGKPPRDFQGYGMA